MDIGSIAVVHDGSESQYTDSISGEERSRALGPFFRGLPNPGYEFWHIPGGGGARKITAADADVDPAVVDYYWDDAGEKRRP